MNASRKQAFYFYKTSISSGATDPLAEQSESYIYYPAVGVISETLVDQTVVDEARCTKRELTICCVSTYNIAVGDMISLTLGGLLYRVDSVATGRYSFIRAYAYEH